MSYYFYYPKYYGFKNYQVPEVSRVSNTNQLAVPIDEIRKDLRLFGDTSRDTEIRSYIFAAQEAIGKKLSRPISSTSISDYYKCLSNAMQLHHNPDDTNMISIEYYDEEDNLVEFETLDNRNDSGTNIFVDFSGDSYATQLNLTKAGIDAINDIKYSETRSNPVQITYTGEDFALDGQEAMRLAVRKYIIALWGDSDPVAKEVAKHDMEKLIAPHRKIYI